MTFNFLPSNTRGKGDYGWLKTNYSFSFSNYYDPNRMGFGPLRVLNDDTIAGGSGFPAHSHRDMEIITLVLEGALAHKDSTGVEAIINAGDVQIMSAGTGITHSEYNASDSEPVKLFQIWIEPKTKNLPPRYEQKNLDWLNLNKQKPNTWHTIASPQAGDDRVQIFQQAWLSVANLESETNLEYKLKNQSNGVFLIVIDGELEVKLELKIGDQTQKMDKRDAVEITDFDNFEIKAGTKTSVLVIEISLK